MEITINMLLSILTGIIAGIYSGIIVARMSRFEEIKHEIKRIILNIDFIYSSGKPKIIPRKDITELLLLSCDFCALKHPDSGEQTSILQKEIIDVLDSPPEKSEKMNELYSEWQNRCRNLKPTYRVIFSPKPWV